MYNSIVIYKNKQGLVGMNRNSNHRAKFIYMYIRNYIYSIVYSVIQGGSVALIDSRLVFYSSDVGFYNRSLSRKI